jgi:hypothetical protein
VRRALADEAAAVEDEQPVDEGGERMHDVLDPNNRDAAAANIPDQIYQRHAFVFGEAAGDLVEEQHARLRGERARQLEPLAVEQREGAGESVRLGCEAALVEPFDAARIDLALATAGAERRGDHEILEHRHAAERLRNLKRPGDAHAAAAVRRKMRDVDAGKEDAAGVGRQRAAGDAEQRGLACAVRSDDAERVALGEREIDRVRNDDGAEPLGYPVEAENGRHCARLRRCQFTTTAAAPRRAESPWRSCWW